MYAISRRPLARGYIFLRELLRRRVYLKSMDDERHLEHLPIELYLKRPQLSAVSVQLVCSSKSERTSRRTLKKLKKSATYASYNRSYQLH